MVAVWRLDKPESFRALVKKVHAGKIVVVDNGPTGALVCRYDRPLMDFKERPSNQALSAWGDLQYFWSHYRDFKYYCDAHGVSSVVVGGFFEGKSFLRFRLRPIVARFPDMFGVPGQAINNGLFQVFSSGYGDDTFSVIQRVLLSACRKRYVFVTSTNRRGVTPARGENGLIDWASQMGLPLFLLPLPVRHRFDAVVGDSFPIVEAQANGFVICRKGWIDMESVCYGVPMEVCQDTK